MATTDPKILALRQKVEAAQQEFDMAVTFHEVWKPAAYDTDLHARMGTSYATQAFLITRTALRREMVLALMRIWDRDPRSVGMQLIIDAIQTNDMMSALTDDCAAKFRELGSSQRCALIWTRRRPRQSLWQAETATVAHTRQYLKCCEACATRASRIARPLLSMPPDQT